MKQEIASEVQPQLRVAKSIWQPYLSVMMEEVET
jgi:hypothetical protein